MHAGAQDINIALPEAPNERIDITSSPWLRIGDPIDLEDPSTDYGDS